MKSAILLEEGDIQFLAFVVAKCFLAQRQRTAQFLKSCLGSAVDQSDTRYRKFGEVGATKVYLWWRNKAFSCPKAATCGFTDSPVIPAGVAEVFAAPKSQIGLAKSHSPL
jgi:hypothetical protein